jgi:hypothetical protein
MPRANHKTHLVLVAKNAADAAEEIERGLPIATEVRVFRILVVATLVPFKGDHR